MCTQKLWCISVLIDCYDLFCVLVGTEVNVKVPLLSIYEGYRYFLICLLEEASIFWLNIERMWTCFLKHFCYILPVILKFYGQMSFWTSMTLLSLGHPAFYICCIIFYYFVWTLASSISSRDYSVIIFMRLLPILNNWAQ